MRCAARALRGEGSEITTLDNDAYLEGYRVSIKRPSRLLVDEVAVTLAYLGDLNEPNVFTRLDRMSDHNYSQILVAKRRTLAAGGAAGGAMMRHSFANRSAGTSN